MEFNGLGGVKTTVVTGYCPVVSTSPGSVLSQHLAYTVMHTNDDESSEHYIPEDCVHYPCTLFGHDLKKILQSRQDLDHQLLVMGDFNLEYCQLRSWMADIALVDRIEKKHGIMGLTRTHT